MSVVPLNSLKIHTVFKQCFYFEILKFTTPIEEKIFKCAPEIKKIIRSKLINKFNHNPDHKHTLPIFKLYRHAFILLRFNQHHVSLP